jgi:hypothetical protein
MKKSAKKAITPSAKSQNKAKAAIRGPAKVSHLLADDNPVQDDNGQGGGVQDDGNGGNPVQKRKLS